MSEITTDTAAAEAAQVDTVTAAELDAGASDVEETGSAVPGATPEPGTAEVDEDQGDDDTGKGNGEAAKWRTKFREAEAATAAANERADAA